MGISKKGQTKNIYFSKTTFGSALRLVCVWNMDLIFLEKPSLTLSWEKPFPRGEFQMVSILDNMQLRIKPSSLRADEI